MSDNIDTMSNQYLTFKLDGDFYALSISSVKEVLEYMQITRVPRTQEYMRGVINVRGNRDGDSRDRQHVDINSIQTKGANHVQNRSVCQQI